MLFRKLCTTLYTTGLLFSGESLTRFFGHKPHSPNYELLHIRAAQRGEFPICRFQTSKSVEQSEIGELAKIGVFQAIPKNTRDRTLAEQDGNTAMNPFLLGFARPVKRKTDVFVREIGVFSQFARDAEGEIKRFAEHAPVVNHCTEGHGVAWIGTFAR